MPPPPSAHPLKPPWPGHTATELQSHQEATAHVQDAVALHSEMGVRGMVKYKVLFYYSGLVTQ